MFVFLELQDMTSTIRQVVFSDEEKDMYESLFLSSKTKFDSLIDKGIFAAYLESILHYV